MSLLLTRLVIEYLGDQVNAAARRFPPRSAKRFAFRPPTDAIRPDARRWPLSLAPGFPCRRSSTGCRPRSPRMQSLARTLADYDTRTALVTPDGEISYRDLAARSPTAAEGFGSHDDSCCSSQRTQSMRWRPLAASPPGTRFCWCRAAATYGARRGVRRSVSRPRPPARGLSRSGGYLRPCAAPDLALLLSTSGSTSSPSGPALAPRRRVQCGAIATYLSIRPATAPPPPCRCRTASACRSQQPRHTRRQHHPHRPVRGRLLFWRLFQDQHGTSFASVPCTFGPRPGSVRLDAAADLRYVTRGGHLPPDRVAARHARAARRLEAVRRVRSDPGDRPDGIPAAGVADPARRRSDGRTRGKLRLEPDGVPADHAGTAGTGELATLTQRHARLRGGTADLSLGRTVHELHTGDIARRGADQLYGVGRRSRFATSSAFGSTHHVGGGNPRRARRHRVLRRRAPTNSSSP